MSFCEDVIKNFLRSDSTDIEEIEHNFPPQDIRPYLEVFLDVWNEESSWNVLPNELNFSVGIFLDLLLRHSVLRASKSDYQMCAKRE